MQKRALGTCYYPEHWPKAMWTDDARRMKEAGLTFVRIGEFSWSKIEPSPGDLQFEWLDDAINVLSDAGLKIVLGTPTATPPRWMISKHPDMLALDADGRPRKFGSRRHYCFSHQGYRAECARIVKRFAKRYGRLPALAAWQTDNEYGCHDTTLSYSDAARDAFRTWLRTQYPGSGNDGDIDALNKAWGNVFWSMEYADFDEIELPNLTVTEPNPAHVMAFRRFTSEQVISFDQSQIEIIRAHSKAPITHNFMGRTLDFDHFKVGDALDFASWDSYPLGFLEDRIETGEEHKARFARQGDPDFQAFHHDLYRAVGKGRWWVMEQQPGPVNWAPYNPAPQDGMVRLWGLEAFAHGAEAVSYFRWRQVPFGQEQLHSGLLNHDDSEARGLHEVSALSGDLEKLAHVSAPTASVALIFDYEAAFASATQPHGRNYDYFQLVFEHYQTLRSLGQTIDILPPTATNFDDYQLILAPGLIHMSGELKALLSATSALVLVGPRSGTRRHDMQLPVPAGPNIPGLDVEITQVETLRPNCPISLKNGGAIIRYREQLAGDATVIEETTNGDAVIMRDGNLLYVGGWLDAKARQRVMTRLLHERGITALDLPKGLRRVETKDEIFWFNYDQTAHEVDGHELPPSGVFCTSKADKAILLTQ